MYESIKYFLQKISYNVLQNFKLKKYSILSNKWPVCDKWFTAPIIINYLASQCSNNTVVLRDENGQSCASSELGIIITIIVLK